MTGRRTEVGTIEKDKINQHRMGEEIKSGRSEKQEKERGANIKAHGNN